MVTLYRKTSILNGADTLNVFPKIVKIFAQNSEKETFPKLVKIFAQNSEKETLPKIVKMFAQNRKK